MGSNFKEDLLHRWSNPTGGPFAGIVHVGLEQDVWDWTVASAQVVNPDGTKTAAPLLSFHDWSQTVNAVPSTFPGGADPLVPSDPLSVEAGVQNYFPQEVIGRGFLIINNDAVPATISELAVANVVDLKLGLEDLNRRTMEQLAEMGRLEFLPEFEPVTVDNAERIAIVLDGDPGQFPGRVLRLERPDLLEGPLFVYARTKTEQAEVGTYGLLGTPLIDGVMAILSADFDKDGDVDGVDFLIWQRAFPTLDGTATSNMGDATGDGNVDGEDFLIWQTQFGSGLGGDGEPAVPEPTAAVLIILAVAAVQLGRLQR